MPNALYGHDLAAALADARARRDYPTVALLAPVLAAVDRARFGGEGQPRDERGRWTGEGPGEAAPAGALDPESPQAVERDRAAVHEATGTRWQATAPGAQPVVDRLVAQRAETQRLVHQGELTGDRATRVLAGLDDRLGRLAQPLPVPTAPGSVRARDAKDQAHVDELLAGRAATREMLRAGHVTPRQAASAIAGYDARLHEVAHFDWNEEAHPRDEHGKFAPAGGGGAESKPSEPAARTGRTDVDRIESRIQRWKLAITNGTQEMATARAGRDRAGMRAAVGRIAQASAQLQGLYGPLDTARRAAGIAPPPPTGGGRPAPTPAERYVPPPLTPIADRAEAERIWTASTPDGLHSVVTSFSGDARYARVSGQVRDRNGDSVGTFSRNIDTQAGNIYHAYFALNPAAQGSGFGNAFNQQAFDAYRAHGYSTATVSADLNVGGYTWARQGFDFADRHDRENMIRRFEQRAANWRTTTAATPEVQRAIRAEVAGLRDRQGTRHPPTAYEMSQVGKQFATRMTLPSGRETKTWFGKEAMLGTVWHGRVKLQEQEPHRIPLKALFARVGLAAPADPEADDGMDAATSAVLLALHDAWVQDWLAKEGEPPLSRDYPTPPTETEGDGQYCLNALTCDATPEQEDDWDRRVAAAGLRIGEAQFEWSEEAHPRDEHGKFAPAGGDGGATVQEAPLPAPHTAAREPDTQTKYKGPSGQYTPERAALHAQIVHGLVDPVPVSAHPVVYTMGGGGGSGKSFVLGAGVVDVPDKAHAAHINADDIKLDLPEYQEKASKKDPTAAGHVHEESSDVTKEAIAAAQTAHKDVVLDAVMNTSADVVADKVAGWRKGGAERVEATYVAAPLQQALDSARARGERTGRVVDEGVLRSAHASVSRMFPELLERHPFDKLTLVSNVIGQKPRVLLSQEADGRVRIHDRAGYRAFLAGGRQ